MKLTLNKAIDVRGEEVSELELEEPTGGDVIDLGQPMNIAQDGSFSFKMDVVAKYVVKLAKIPMSSVREISPSDLMACAVMVAGFFGDTAA
ncbi:MAG: phage tail assembly protein [Gammaproteobacteria bacterium]|nr:phage tail assembly protein [Gammaproteobacteria bacterium]